MEKYKSLLHETVSTTKTDVWNDSCSIKELTYAIEHGVVGATSNPTIVLNVLKQEMDSWENRLHEIIENNPNWTEVEVTWKIFEEIGVKGADLLYPVFVREGGKKGRLSIQTNPANYRNPDRHRKIQKRTTTQKAKPIVKIIEGNSAHNCKRKSSTHP